MQTKECTKCGGRRGIKHFRVLRKSRVNRKVRGRVLLVGDPIYHPWCRSCESAESAHKQAQKRGKKATTSVSTHHNVPAPAPDYVPTLGDA